MSLHNLVITCTTISMLWTWRFFDPLFDDVTHVNKTENGPYLGGDLTHELMPCMLDIAEVPSIWSCDPLFDDVTHVNKTENGLYLGGDLTHKLVPRTLDIVEVPSI